MEHLRWNGKPYYSLDSYFKSVYGEKIYKISLDGGFTCPVRDGRIHDRGCIFCSAGGSGEFSAASLLSAERPSVTEQISAGRDFIRSKYRGRHFVAYLQPYTNTYGPVEQLRRVYTEALSEKDIIGLSIATRPDCLGPEVLRVLKEMQELFPQKFIWIELGLQTIHPASIKYIRRGYDTSVFESAMHSLADLHIPVIVHLILGLPGEDRAMMLSNIEYINTFPVFGIKLQLLHVLKDTDLAADYSERKFDVLTKDEYIDIVIDCLEHLSPETVIHRVTGDGPKNLLIAPAWSSNKKGVLNLLHSEMEARASFQGRLYTPDPTGFRTV
ncbi:MAG: TIGR01212 family radical SAM protein [Lachnospiraceae bacterium]|nr:TIGR01212 family radical SAM protein [Lachnospiraceae bacterium]